MQILDEAMLEVCGVQKNDAVLLGLSGGADSVALCHELVKLREDGFLSAVYAGHLHHGIRGGSADMDTAFCRELCQQLGVPLTVELADVPAYGAAHGETLEQAARTVRYGFLQRLAEKVGAQWIATAHHQEDQAETVLLHLLRGCGVSGLAGMRKRTGNLIRPLLDTSKQDIRAYLKHTGLCWREDETNDEDCCTRNRIRHNVMPQLRRINPNASAALAKTGALATLDEDFLMGLAKDAVEQATADGGGYDRRMLSQTPLPVQSRAMRLLLNGLSLSGRSFDVTEADIRRVAGLLTAQTGTCIQLRNGMAAWIDSRYLYLGQYPQQAAFERPLTIPGSTLLPDGGRLEARWANAFALAGDEMEAYLDFDRLPKGLVARSRRNGDRIFPLGGIGRRKLSDYFTDKKIPRHQRDSIVLLASGEEIYWVAGQGISKLAAITEETRRIVHITYCKGEGKPCEPKT